MGKLAELLKNYSKFGASGEVDEIATAEKAISDYLSKEFQKMLNLIGGFKKPPYSEKFSAIEDSCDSAYNLLELNKKISVEDFVKDQLRISASASSSDLGESKGATESSFIAELCDYPVEKPLTEQEIKEKLKNKVDGLVEKFMKEHQEILVQAFDAEFEKNGAKIKEAVMLEEKERESQDTALPSDSEWIKLWYEDPKAAFIKHSLEKIKRAVHEETVDTLKDEMTNYVTNYKNETGKNLFELACQYEDPRLAVHLEAHSCIKSYEKAQLAVLTENPDIINIHDRFHQKKEVRRVGRSMAATLQTFRSPAKRIVSAEEVIISPKGTVRSPGGQTVVFKAFDATLTTRAGEVIPVDFYTEKNVNVTRSLPMLPLAPEHEKTFKVSIAKLTKSTKGKETFDWVEIDTARLKTMAGAKRGISQDARMKSPAKHLAAAAKLPVQVGTKSRSSTKFQRFLIDITKKRMDEITPLLKKLQYDRVDVAWHWCHLYAFSLGGMSKELAPAHVRRKIKFLEQSDDWPQVEKNFILGTSEANGKMNIIETALKNIIYKTKDPAYIRVVPHFQNSDEERLHIARTITYHIKFAEEGDELTYTVDMLSNEQIPSNLEKEITKQIFALRNKTFKEKIDKELGLPPKKDEEKKLQEDREEKKEREVSGAARRLDFSKPHKTPQKTPISDPELHAAAEVEVEKVKGKGAGTLTAYSANANKSRDTIITRSRQGAPAPKESEKVRKRPGFRGRD